MKSLTIKVLVCFMVLSLMFSNICLGQYQKSFGVRLGKFTTGLTYKNLIGEDNASGYEIFLGHTKAAQGGYMATVLYTHNVSIFNPQLQLNLDFTIGVGPYVGYFDKGVYSYNSSQTLKYHDNLLSVGVNGYLGLEYHLRSLPISVGIEANPHFAVIHQGPEWIDISLPIRYTF